MRELLRDFRTLFNRGLMVAGIIMISLILATPDTFSELVKNIPSLVRIGILAVTYIVIGFRLLRGRDLRALLRGRREAGTEEPSSVEADASAVDGVASARNISTLDDAASDEKPKEPDFENEDEFYKMLQELSDRKTSEN